ncbi:MAG: hypothetical protein ACKO5K_07055, partial [Armatimonadota bacterium]
MRSAVQLLPLVALLCVAGCRRAEPAGPSKVSLHPDAVLVRDPGSGVDLVDVRVGGEIVASVVAEGVDRIGGNHVGDARTAAEWLERSEAIVAINGGFFGDTYDAAGRRRQIVQLAVVD